MTYVIVPLQLVAIGLTMVNILNGVFNSPWSRLAIRGRGLFVVGYYILVLLSVVAGFWVSDFLPRLLTLLLAIVFFISVAFRD